MRILIGCEYSGRVREAFRALGHDAWSCDLLDSEDDSPYHIKGDVLQAANGGGGQGLSGTLPRTVGKHARLKPCHPGFLSCTRTCMQSSSISCESATPASLCCTERTSGEFACEKYPLIDVVNYGK